MSDEKIQAIKVLSRFALGLGILGGLFGAFGIYFLIAANKSLSWSSVEGAVVKAEVKTHVSRRANTSGATPNLLIEYYVSVHYTYDVKGEPYVSSRYSLGEGDRASRFYAKRSGAEVEAAKSFPIDSRLQVYFDPDMPTSAVLEPGWNWGTFVPLLLGLFFGGAGGFFYWVLKTAKES